MAQKSTIYKAELSVSDMDRHYYETHKLTVAKHPSETDERLMIRLLAFASSASGNLEFSKGLSADDEPDIWEKSLSGEIDLWITLGHRVKRLFVSPAVEPKPSSSTHMAAKQRKYGGIKSKRRLLVLII